MIVALTIGAILNVTLLLVFGGMTVYKFVARQETQFEAPLPSMPLEPPTVKYNQKKSKDRQEASARPRQQRIEVRSALSINAPDIQINVSDVAPSVGVGGDGSGFAGGTGSLRGTSLRMGQSAVDFFGIRSKGERIVIVLDVARSMLEPQRGDITGYEDVKEKLSEVIDNLSSASLFNVMVFSSGLDVMSSNLVLASKENKQRAIDFIDPYWRTEGGRISPSAKKSVFLRNYKPDWGGVKPINGSSRMDMALLAAFEQKADNIFMITDGTPKFTRTFNEKERRAYEREIREYERRVAKVSDAERAAFEKKAKAYVDKQNSRLKAENKKRAAQGLDGRIHEGNWAKTLTPPWGKRPRDNVLVGGNEWFVDWMKERATLIYGDKKSDLPSVNIIGYAIPKKGNTADFLNDLKSEFPNSRFSVFGKHEPNA